MSCRAISILLLFWASSEAFAAPVVSAIGRRVPIRLDQYTFHLDPDGETYSAVQVTITPTAHEFLNVLPDPLFDLPAPSTGAIGIGTLTSGFQFLGYDSESVGSKGLQFGFTSFGPPTSSFTGDLVQITGPTGLGFVASFRFQDSSGNVIDRFTQNLATSLDPSPLTPEPATAALGGLAIAGVLGFRRRR